MGVWFEDHISRYIPVFILLSAVCAYLVYTVQQKESNAPVKTTPEFDTLRRKYLIVYLLMMGADWLQGPYVYKLYDFYGFSMKDIADLFIVGFGSSMIAGTFVGALADKYGRKNNCLVFAVVYSASCITKHFNNYTVLMFGRVLAGIATSILYSAFESWLIAEHRKGSYPEEWLSDVFSKAIFGNSLIAILSGLVATVLAETFGFVAPFDGALCMMAVGGFLIFTQWSENYGDAEVTTVSAGFQVAIDQMKADPKIWQLGVVCSFFEGSMFIFVFMWTPALELGGIKISHGLIFAEFMLSVMIGSQAFALLSKQYNVESLGQYMLLAALGCFLLCAVVEAHFIRLFAFLFFEACVGVYWPVSGILRSKYIPESSRATIMNLFRIPLNAIVLITLLNINNIPQFYVFCTCACLLGCAYHCQVQLMAGAPKPSSAAPGGPAHELLPVSDADVEAGVADATV